MEIPRRPLGKTGEEVSIIGVGGFHVGMASLPDAEAVRLIRAAIDAGVRGFRPLDAGELQRIRAKTAPLAVSGDGRYELYKASMRHEGPPGRRLHGFPPVEEAPY